MDLGPLLGAAFDKAAWLCVRNRALLILWSALSIATAIFAFFGQAQASGFLINVADFVWVFFAAAMAVRTYAPGFRMTNLSAGQFFGASIIVAMVGLLGPIALWIAYRNVAVNLASLVLFTLYLGPRLAFAPLLALMCKTGTFDALTRSWGLTRDRFWISWLFVVVSTLAVIVASALPSAALGFAAGFALSKGWATTAAFAAITSIGQAVLFPVSAYADLAQDLAYVFFLQKSAAVPASDPGEAALDTEPAPITYPEPAD